LAEAPERSFACACGRLSGRVAAGGSETHALCHCRDCRAAVTVHGRPDPGAADILQTSPDRVRIERGGDLLAALRLRARGGGIRWYASCCGAPLFFTPPLPRAAMVGIAADRLEGSPLPPVAAEAFLPAPGGGTRHRGGLRFAGEVLSRMLAANLSGRWRETPFFDREGKPAVPPRRLTEAERGEAYGRLG
jgi:hypothetical protein